MIKIKLHHFVLNKTLLLFLLFLLLLVLLIRFWFFFYAFLFYGLSITVFRLSIRNETDIANRKYMKDYDKNKGSSSYPYQWILGCKKLVWLGNVAKPSSK